MIKTFLLLLLLVFPGLSNAVVKDYYLNGGTTGAAENFSSGRHAWDAGRIRITDAYTIRRLRVRMRRVECEQPGGSCTPGANRVHPYFNARIYTHDYKYDRPGKLVGSVSSNAINFNTDITSLTTSKSDKATPFIDVWFNDLNAKVMPGLYWIVIYNVDWTNVYPNHLDHYIQLEATNIGPIGGGSIYGRALSYTLGNVENTVSWTEKYYGQLNFAVYDDAGGSANVYYVVPSLSNSNGTIIPSTPQKSRSLQLRRTEGMLSSRRNMRRRADGYKSYDQSHLRRLYGHCEIYPEKQPIGVCRSIACLSFFLSPQTCIMVAENFIFV